MDGIITNTASVVADQPDPTPLNNTATESTSVYLYYLHVSLIARDYCPAFFDDFSNPSSGWSVGEDDFVRVEYLGGEYRVLSKNGDYIYLFRAPACPRQNYTVEMDARWVGGTGDSYGLLFGITGNFSQYYMFDMNTDYRMFRLLPPAEARPGRPPRRVRGLWGPLPRALCRRAATGGQG